MIGALALLLAAAEPTGVRVPIVIDPIPPMPDRIDILDDQCAGARGDEIVVCGRPGDQGAYRLPESRGFDPAGDTPSVSRERNALLEEGASGIGSCSPSGAGGMTGCTVRQWRRQEQQRAGQ